MMKRNGPYLDCCDAPQLETVKTFFATETQMAAIRRCRNCKSHWFYQLREILRELDRIPDEDEQDAYDRNIWYVRLTPAEADDIARLPEAPDPDRFADRPGFLMDANGMNRIQGTPAFLRK